MINWIKIKISNTWDWIRIRSKRFWGFFATAFVGSIVLAAAFVPPVGDGDFISSYAEKASRYERVMPQTLQDSGESKVVISKSRPQVNFMKWRGVVNMGVYYAGLEKTEQQFSVVEGKTVDIKVNPPGSRVLGTDRVEWKRADQEVHMYPLDPAPGMEDGGFEIEIVLKQKPTSNVFDFQLSGWQDLDFFYQSALTQQEIDDGASRPDNIVGSYAVYHKFLVNNREESTNYATGKAYHIFRPKVIDVLGTEVWGELSYAEGVLTVTVSQSFLDTAKYPVKIDPAFGYATIGATNQSWFGQTITGTKFTTIEAGTLTKMTAYVRSATSDSAVGMGIYDDSSGPNNLLTEDTGDATATDPIAWQSANVSLSLSDATVYFISVFNAGTSGQFNIRYDSGATAQAFDKSATFETWTDPMTGESAKDRKYSVFATYTKDTDSSSSWCDTSYSNRQQVIVSSIFIDDDLTDFPLMVIPNATATSTAQTDGDDFFFVEEANCTKLDYQIDDEDTDFHTGTPAIHVKVPTMSSSTETVLLMYYGNSGAASQENATSTWNDAYKAVWHLEETPNASTTDSTQNSNDGNPENMTSDDQVIGQIDGSLDFDGSDDKVNIGDIDAIDGISKLTMSAWVQTRTRTDYDGILNKNNDSEDNRTGLAVGGVSVGENNDAQVLIANGSNTAGFTTGNILVDGVWNHWVAVFDGTQSGNDARLRFWFNGFEQTLSYLGTIPSTTSSGTGQVVLGFEQASRFLDGQLDEVRISNIVLSTDWIKFEYYNQSGLFGVPSFGGEESVSVTTAETSETQVIIY